MNPFVSVVPPNMDVVCSYQYVSTSSLQISTTTCSNPMDYYKGYGIDVLLVVLVGALVIKVLI